MPSIDPTLSEILRATRIAILGHAGQTRKASRDPYAVHPIRVAERILAGPTPPGLDRRAAVLAAILHDLLEDTEVPRSRLVEEFGEPVVRVVDEVTQDAALPREERRRKMVEGCGSYSLEGRVVKLADRWDNLTELQNMSRDFVRRYCDESRRMLENMKGTWPEAAAAILRLVELHEEEPV